MDDYQIPIPKKKKELIKLNTYPKINPFKDFDGSLEAKTPKTLYTPLSDVKEINLFEKIVNMTNKDKEEKEKSESASWLRKFTFTEGSGFENRTNKVSDIKEPVNFDEFMKTSFIDKDDNLDLLNHQDFLPGKNHYMLFDTDETNFELVSMKKNVLGYPSKITLKKDDETDEYTCFAKNLSDHYLLEVNDEGVFYYPISNSLKLNKIKRKEETTNNEE